jgi:hypothetical protein
MWTERRLLDGGLPNTEMCFCHNTNARRSHSVTFKKPGTCECIPCATGTMIVTTKSQR